MENKRKGLTPWEREIRNVKKVYYDFWRRVRKKRGKFQVKKHKET